METLAKMTSSRAKDTERVIYTTLKGSEEVKQVSNVNLQVRTFETSISLWSLCWLYLFSNKKDIFIFNGEVKLISFICSLKFLSFNTKASLIAVDIVLRVPNTWFALISSKIKKLLFKQVDQFIHYFRDLKGYEIYYGITAERSRYVPFKSNIFHEATTAQKDQLPKGDYVFSAGRSLRDYQTLIEAARINKLPTAILCTTLSDWQSHGTLVNLDDLPDNVTLIKDDGSKSGWIRGLKNARIVAVPTLPKSICASGIGTYLDAMALGKPVILTKGVGTSDVLENNQACFVAAKSPSELASSITNLWQDRQLAEEISMNGQRYALSLGDEKALARRILKAAVQG